MIYKNIFAIKGTQSDNEKKNNQRITLFVQNWNDHNLQKIIYFKIISIFNSCTNINRILQQYPYAKMGAAKVMVICHSVTAPDKLHKYHVIWKISQIK